MAYLYITSIELFSNDIPIQGLYKRMPFCKHINFQRCTSVYFKLYVRFSSF